MTVPGDKPDDAMAAEFLIAGFDDETINQAAMPRPLDAEMIVYDFTDELSRAFRRRAAKPEKGAFLNLADRILPPRTPNG